MDTVKLVDLLRERQESERLWAFLQASRLGEDILDMDRDLRDIDVEVLAECVMDGVRFMMRTEPGALRLIDLSLLQMNQTGSCILGQSLGWGEGVQLLHEDQEGDEHRDAYVWKHGFDIPSVGRYGNGKAWSYHDLSIAWESVIQNLDRLEGV